MTGHRIDELLDAKRDGTLDSPSATELERELRQNSAARRRAEEIDSLSQILDVVADEPPAAIVSDVMEKISALPVRRPGARVIRWFPRSTSGGGMVMAKKVMFGVAAAAAIVLISVAITGFPHMNSSGTLARLVRQSAHRRRRLRHPT